MSSAFWSSNAFNVKVQQQITDQVSALTEKVDRLLQGQAETDALTRSLRDEILRRVPEDPQERKSDFMCVAARQQPLAITRMTAGSSLGSLGWSQAIWAANEGLKTLNPVEFPSTPPESHRLVSALRGQAKRLHAKGWFMPLISLVILANSVTIGMQAEWELHNVGGTVPLFFQLVGWAFFAVFLIEVFIRLVSEGLDYFKPKNTEFRWNVFDCALICADVLQRAMSLFGVTNVNLSFMRLCRLLRILRVLRAFKATKHFKELRIMISGVTHCGKPLCWAIVLLGLLSFMYVVFLVQMSSEWLHELSVKPDSITASDQETVTFLFEYFGSLWLGMYTLFKCITGGMDWETVSDPLRRISPFLVVAFCLYVALGTLCMLNLITAVFLETAANKSKAMFQRESEMDDMSNSLQWIDKTKALFKSVLNDVDAGRNVRDGSDPHETISLFQFQSLLWTSPRVMAHLANDGLHMYSAGDIFNIIDDNGDGTIDLNEFVAGLHRLKGELSPLHMSFEFNRILRKVESLHEYFEQARAEGPPAAQGEPPSTPLSV